MLRRTLVLAIFIANTFFIVHSKQTGKCKIDDEKCMIDVGNEVFHKFAKGSPDDGLISMDPLFIEKMDIVQKGNVSVQIDLKFTNASLIGLSNAKVSKITGFKKDPAGNILEIQFKTPLGILEGPYKIDGKLLILPITGNGLVTMKFKDLDIHLKFLTKKVERSGKVYMEVEKSKFKYEVTFASVHFTNLFNGDKALGDNMNLFLNANWKLLLDELNKPISSSFAKIFKDAMNTFLKKTPYDELFIH